METKTIDSFTGSNSFLSNFYTNEFMYCGNLYQTAEHAFQAAKATNAKDKRKIRLAKNGAEAKKLGRRVKMRDDWESIKIQVMHDILLAKFLGSKFLMTKLLETGSSTLIEGNHWNDTFWGVCKGKGQNHLGKLLMKVRESLKPSYTKGK